MLSSTSEYAIRAATYIAQQDDKGPISAKDIAEAVDVPVKYRSEVQTCALPISQKHGQERHSLQFSWRGWWIQYETSSQAGGFGGYSDSL